MKSFEKRDLIDCLKSVGVNEGDTVYLQSQLYSLGKPQINLKSREEFCQFFIDTVRGVVGKKGTIVVPTMSTQIGRETTIYDPNETNSNYGTLPQYVAKLDSFTRSLHPLISVAAQGPLAEDICGAQSTHNFNIFSPFERMVQNGAKNIFLGVRLSQAAQIVHYSEFIFGVPYFYNKILSKRPRIDGALSSHLTGAAVRYMHADTEQDLSAAETVLLESGICHMTTIGDGQIICAKMSDMVQVLTSELEKNPYFLLRATPVFPFGDPPMDGNQHYFKPSMSGFHEKKRSSLDVLFHKAAVHNLSFAKALQFYAENHLSDQHIKQLSDYSEVSMREFAWAWTTCASNKNMQGANHIIASLSNPTQWKAHNFALGYFFAPFADVRTLSASLGFELEFAHSLSKRFSHEFQYDRHETVPSVEKLSERKIFSDIFMNLRELKNVDIFMLAQKCHDALVEGGAALVELDFDRLYVAEHSDRNLEKFLQDKFSEFNLFLERVYSHENHVSCSLVLRKYSSKSV